MEKLAPTLSSTFNLQLQLLAIQWIDKSIGITILVSEQPYKRPRGPVVKMLAFNADVSRSSHAQHMSIIKKYNTYVLSLFSTFYFFKHIVLS